MLTQVPLDIRGWGAPSPLWSSDLIPRRCHGALGFSYAPCRGKDCWPSPHRYIGTFLGPNICLIRNTSPSPGGLLASIHRQSYVLQKGAHGPIARALKVEVVAALPPSGPLPLSDFAIDAGCSPVPLTFVLAHKYPSLESGDTSCHRCAKRQGIWHPH